MAFESRGHILFADDDAMVLRAIGAALSLSGFEVTMVENTSQALAAVEARIPDVLLVDIDMPGNHNLELVQALSKDTPLVPVVILTGHPALETAVRALQLGVVDYLIKPHRVEELLERLDLAVHRARVLRSVGETESAADELSRQLHALKGVIGSASAARLPQGALAPRPESVDPLRNLTPPELARLSARERDVLRELARGHSPQRIAKSLHLSTNTVRNHLKSIFVKLQVNSQVALLGKLATPRP